MPNKNPDFIVFRGPLRVKYYIEQLPRDPDKFYVEKILFNRNSYKKSSTTTIMDKKHKDELIKKLSIEAKKQDKYYKEGIMKKSDLKKINEKAKSKAQQAFMGMVDAAQKGEKPASPEVAKAAKGMSHKEVKKYASTPTKNLPQHVKKEADDPLQHQKKNISLQRKGLSSQKPTTNAGKAALSTQKKNLQKRSDDLGIQSAQAKKREHETNEDFPAVDFGDDSNIERMKVEENKVRKVVREMIKNIIKESFDNYADYDEPLPGRMKNNQEVDESYPPINPALKLKKQIDAIKNNIVNAKKQYDSNKNSKRLNKGI